jgi:hypothetical protein
LKVRVISAAFRSYWYADHIGEVFDVEERPDAAGDYRLTSLNPSPYRNRHFFVHLTDIEIVQSKSQAEPPGVNPWNI